MVEAQGASYLDTGIGQRSLHAELRPHVVAIHQSVGRLITQHQVMLAFPAPVVEAGAEEQVAAGGTNIGSNQRPCQRNLAASDAGPQQGGDPGLPEFVVCAAGNACPGFGDKLLVSMFLAHGAVLS